MELLDIRDVRGSRTGEVKERQRVHEDGDLHGTSHVWIVRRNDRGKYELLLQKRSADKDSFPGCYDISSAGHIPAGQDYLPSAIRELEEELGICAAAEDLVFLGMHEGYCREEFYGKPFINHEISKVYLYIKPVDEKELILQKEEVDSVSWMELDECFRRVLEKDPSYIMFPDELTMIKKWCDVQSTAANSAEMK